MSMMNELLKSTSLKSENGDATSTYDCELARNNITVREFAEAVENSVNGRGQEFNEGWATVSMAIVGHSRFPPVAEYTIYGASSGSRLHGIELDGKPSTFFEILSHYGKYIVDSCQWNGGFGSGGYYLKIKKDLRMTQPSELFSICEDLREKALSAKTSEERMHYALLKHACESDILNMANNPDNLNHLSSPIEQKGAV